MATHKKTGLRVVSSLMGILVTALGLVIAFPQVSQAQQPNNSWSTNAIVGTRGQTSGGFVVAAQNFFYAAYSITTDGQWGTQSRTATLDFQAQFGLSQDGCVGPATWTQMQAYVVSTCSAGYTCGETNRAAEIGKGKSLYLRTNCDWASYPAGSQTIGGSIKHNVE